MHHNAGNTVPYPAGHNTMGAKPEEKTHEMKQKFCLEPKHDNQFPQNI